MRPVAVDGIPSNDEHEMLCATLMVALGVRQAGVGLGRVNLRGRNEDGHGRDRVAHGRCVDPLADPST
jgi:hypothetical protein